MAVEYQQKGSSSGFDISTVVEGGYNLHSHTAASCFGKSCSLVKSGASVNNKRKAASQQNECRYRYPQRKKRRTTVQNASDSPVQWFLWDGTHEERYIKEVCPERHSYDAFQNVSCRAISHSKLACNTNVSIVMDGPTGQYSFKYNMKGTQKDDEKEYGRVEEATRKVLSSLRLHQSDSSEGVRRLLAASFAHQKTNILGSPMASYLTRNKSRFTFSHELVWCPLRDMKHILRGEQTSIMIQHHGRQPFFCSVASNYLCRPLQLENLSPFIFFHCMK